MKSIAIVALIAFLAVSAHVVLADDCDDGDCTSKVAVTQRFQTTDCTGNSTFHIGTNYTQSCFTNDDTGFNTSIAYACSNGAFTSVTNYDSASCTKNSKSLLTAGSVGICSQTGPSRSQISWCNKASASTNFKPAKLATNATVLLRSVECNVTTGCVDLGTPTLRLFSSSDCAAVNQTLVLVASALGGGVMVPGTCYINNGSDTTRKDLMFSELVQDADAYTRSNVISSCTSNGYYTIVSSTGGCGSGANIISSVSYPTDTCMFLSGQYATITCPKKSAAASLLASGPLAFVLILLVAVLLN